MYSSEEVENLISNISVRGLFSYVEDISDFVFISYPSNKDKMLAKSIYNNSFKEAVSEGLLPFKKLEELLYDKGVLTVSSDNELDSLKSKLYGQQVLLSKTTKVRANQDRIKKVISELKEKIDILESTRQSKLLMSAEAKAEEIKNQFLCCNNTYINNKLVWNTFKEYTNGSYSNIKDAILPKYIELINGLDVGTVRFIARHVLWRVRYNCSVKTSDKLFGVPVIDYTNDQFNLAYWSNFYDQVYSMMPEDKPSDDIIEDDELLDAFMDDYYKEMNNDSAISRSNKTRNSGAMSAFNSQEVIVTQSNELYEDIEYDKPVEAMKSRGRLEAPLKN